MNRSNSKSVCFVLTTPFAVNAFLLQHLRALANIYSVSLCVNIEKYPLSAKMDPRVRVFDLGIQRKISLFQDLCTLWHLFFLFRREKFDAVHSMTPKAGLLAMIAAKVAGVSRRYHTYTGQIWVNYSGAKRKFFKLIDRVIARAATRVFADSVSQCRFLKAEGVVPEEKISVLGKGSVCGVDTVRFSSDPVMRKQTRQKLGVPDNACVMVFVGRLARDKGVLDLIQAFTLLATTHPDAVLWLVGPDEENLSSSLQSLASECSNRVCWIGPTFEPERYMTSADFLVLPSYREGFGMVIVEAAACGIPSVAYRIDGVIDAVVEGTTGLLVQKGEFDALGAAMKRLIEDPILRKQLGRDAQKRVSRDFSDTSVVAAWLGFYQHEFDCELLGAH